ncbi:MAG: amidase [Caldisphaera sp.]|jgi:aspartyl-tRNA(Asn)/glutamyl-tRNA(Gln) amidotransferase subunit A|nr:MAG: amidase [Caldisphaera sp.]
MELNNKINAFVTFNENALNEAEELVKNNIEPIPIGVKDIIFTKGIKTTMGSKLYRNFIPKKDAYIVKKIKKFGYVIVGKTNTHEFASGITTTSSIFGPTKNPYDYNRISGGSSGGSAASVSASIVPISIGTDTAGSIRVPASLCGAFGYKPTYGKIDVDGVFPLAKSFDTLGFFSKDFNQIIEISKKFNLYKNIDINKIKIGIPKWYKVPNGLRDYNNELVDKVENKFLDFVAKLGYEYDFVDMKIAQKYVSKYFPVIRYSEATSVHIKNKNKWNQYFPDVKRLLEKGLNFRAVDYLDALKHRNEVKYELKKVSKEFDVLMTPTTPIPAPTIDEVLGKEDGIIRTLLTYETVYSSYAEAPTISIPKLELNNLPVGVQLIGNYNEDSKLLNIVNVLVKNYKN